MPRIRTIKPEFFVHEGLSQLPAETHLFAAGLLCQADDEGYFLAHPQLLRAAIFPLRDCSVSAPGMVMDLSSVGFIRLGKTTDGKTWGQIINFLKHQVVSHPRGSKIKNLAIEWDESGNNHGTFRETSGPEQGNRGTGEQGKKAISEETKNVSSSPRRKKTAAGNAKVAELLYQEYPRKEGHGAAIKEIGKALARLAKGEDPLLPMAKPDAQEFLLAKVQAYARSPAGLRVDRDKIPHPSTWFHQSRYLDDESNWQITGGSNGKYEGAAEYQLRIAAEFCEENNLEPDGTGDIPWRTNGQDGPEPVREASGGGKRG